MMYISHKQEVWPIVVMYSELRTQNSENDLFNPNITFYISLNKYIKLINSFGLGRHLLRQYIVAGTDDTLGCLNKNLLTYI